MTVSSDDFLTSAEYYYKIQMPKKLILEMSSAALIMPFFI